MKNYTNCEAVYVLPWPKRFQSDDDIIVKCLSHIRSMKDAPLDVFDHITDVEVTKFYLPMRHFNGSVSTDWNCIQVFDRKRIVSYEYDNNGKKKPIYEKYEEYLPASGKGTAKFNFLVSVANGNALPKALVNCLGTMSFDRDITDKAQLLADSQIVTDATIVEESSHANHGKIKQAVEKYIDRVADRASFKNLSGRLQDCNYSFNWRYGSAENKKLLVPAFTVTYRYGGEIYTYASVYNSDGRNGEGKREYPKGEVAVLQQVKSQSHSYTKTGWCTFILSLLLTIAILVTWGNLTPKIFRLFSIIGSILILMVIAWQALSISVKYDDITKLGEDLAVIKRTECLKRAFPQYANHPTVNKIMKESDTQRKISKTYSNIRNKRRSITLMILIQLMILIGGILSFANCNPY